MVHSYRIGRKKPRIVIIPVYGVESLGKRGFHVERLQVVQERGAEERGDGQLARIASNGVDRMVGGTAEHHQPWRNES